MRVRVTAVAVAALVAVAAPVAADEPGYTTPIPVADRRAAISGDGRVVAFSTGDRDGNLAAYARDRSAGVTTLLSRSVDGGRADGKTFVSDMSSDGRWVVLQSTASNLVGQALPRGADGEAMQHVYLRDRRAGTTTLVSVEPDGTPATDHSRDGRVSDDGRVIAFTSWDRTLAGGEAPGSEIAPLVAYARDVVAGVTRRPPATQETAAGAVTPDGRYVLYSEGALSLPRHGNSQLWRWDRATGAVAQVSLANGERVGNHAFGGHISADGRHVVFTASAGGSPQRESWRRDMRAPGATRRFASGQAIGLSPDGRTVLDLVDHVDAQGVTTGWTIERDGAVVLRSADQMSILAVSTALRHVVFATDGSFVRDVGLQYPCNSGYRLIASDGGVFAFGSATFHGSTGGIRLNRPIVAAMPTPSGRGYWLVASDGGVFAFGDARFHGSTGSLSLTRPIVGAAATPSGRGYWLVASDGGVFAFGDALFQGRGTDGAASIVATPSGAGYWIVGSGGRVEAFGDATRLPSAAPRAGTRIVGAARSPSGAGLWLSSSDGGVFALGDARFFGAVAPAPLQAPVVGMAATQSGGGYRLVASDGGVFTFGDARFCGSTGAIRLNRPVVAAAG